MAAIALVTLAFHLNSVLNQTLAENLIDIIILYYANGHQDSNIQQKHTQ